MKKNIPQIWLQQQSKEILLHWRKYLIIFKNNFLLIPSTMLIFAYLFGYLNELNRETIEYYFMPLGFLSLLISTFLDVYFPTYTFPYISDAIEDIRDKKDSKVTYIYFLKLKFGDYTIKEHETYVDILRSDGTHSSINKDNIEK